MRVGLDLLFLIPDETGGRETYARELISSMLQIEPGLSATAFVNREAAPELRRTLSQNVPVVGLPVSPRRPAQWAIGELAWLPLAGSRAKVDLMHSLANFGPGGGSFRRVLTIHDLQYRAVPELLTPLRRAGTSALIGLAARRADRIIAVSESTANELVTELRLSPNSIEMIPNGPGNRATSPVPASELRSRLLLGQRPVVLAVSTALPHKNLDTLLMAWTLIPPAGRPLLILAGAGSDGQGLRERARAAGIEAETRLLGFQPGPVLEGLYELASCAVVPSRYEGFGLPVLEAMVRGVPVACSDIPALREVAGNAALKFSPFRAEEIAGAIQRLITDEELADRLRAAGREQAARFSWRRAAEGTLGCYRRTLRGS